VLMRGNTCENLLRIRFKRTDNDDDDDDDDNDDNNAVMTTATTARAMKLRSHRQRRFTTP